MQLSGSKTCLQYFFALFVRRKYRKNLETKNNGFVNLISEYLSSYFVKNLFALLIGGGIAFGIGWNLDNILKWLIMLQK